MAASFGGRRVTTSTGTDSASESPCTSITLNPPTAMPWSSTADTIP